MKRFLVFGLALVLVLGMAGTSMAGALDGWWVETYANGPGSVGSVVNAWSNSAGAWDVTGMLLVSVVPLGNDASGSWWQTLYNGGTANWNSGPVTDPQLVVIAHIGPEGQYIDGDFVLTGNSGTFTFAGDLDETWRIPEETGRQVAGVQPGHGGTVNVPEPMTLLLLGAGLCGVVVSRRKK